MSEPVRREVIVECEVERAFEVFVTEVDLWWPPSHRQLTASKLGFEPKPGGLFYEKNAERRVELGRVLRWEPPSRLTYTWWPGADDAPTEVDVRFVELGASTRVEVVHAEGESGLDADWPRRAKGFARAWGEVLPAFESAV